MGLLDQLGGTLKAALGQEAGAVAPGLIAASGARYHFGCDAKGGSCQRQQSLSLLRQCRRTY